MDCRWLINGLYSRYKVKAGLNRIVAFASIIAPRYLPR